MGYNIIFSMSIQVISEQLQVSNQLIPGGSFYNFTPVKETKIDFIAISSITRNCIYQYREKRTEQL